MGATKGKDGLTIRQRAFIEEYLKDPSNATQAAIRAGYSENAAPSQATKLLENKKIRSRIDQVLDRAISIGKIASETEVLEYTSNVMRGVEKEKIVTKDGEEKEVPYNGQTRVKAAEMLLKVHGSFTERKEVTLNVPQFLDDL